MRKSNSKAGMLLAAALAVVCHSTESAWARNQIFAETGGIAANGGAIVYLGGTSSPVLNNSGMVVFIAVTGQSADQNSGIYEFDSSQSSTSVIATSGQIPTFATSPFTTLAYPLLNDDGQVTFSGGVVGSPGQTDHGIFSWVPGGSAQTIELSNAPLSTGLNAGVPGNVFQNSQGDVAFDAFSYPNAGPNDSGVFFYSGRTGNVPLVLSNTPAFSDPSGPTFKSVQVTSFSGNHVLITARLSGDGVSAPDSGIFIANVATGLSNPPFYSKSVVPLVLQGQTYVGGTLPFTLFKQEISFTIPPTGAGINANQQVVFWAGIGATSGGIFITSLGQQPVAIAVQGDGFVGGSQHFGGFSDFLQLNNAGEVIFNSSLDDSNNQSQALFFWKPGGPPVLISMPGDVQARLNNAGAIAFSAGSSVYLADTRERVLVAGPGQSFDGSTIKSAGIAGANSFNDNGQLAYEVQLANGKNAYVLYTPDLHYRGTDGGNWADAANWTVGILPAKVHDVFIDPAGSLSLNGATADTTVKSLSIGGQASGTTLLTSNGGRLTTVGNLSILPTGELDQLSNTTAVGGVLNNQGRLVVTALGTITAGAFTNSGTLNVSGGTIAATGPITNSGMITGNGTIHTGGLTNAPGATVSLADVACNIDGAVDNRGLVRLTNNTTTFFDPVTNNVGGTFQLINATARFFSGFTNLGTFESGPADHVFDVVQIAPGGFIAAGPGETFTIHGDFTNASSQAANWNTASAKFDLNGSASHHFDVVGNDLGPTRDGYADNFAIGTLSLAPGESLVLQDGNGTDGGALYVGTFSLGGGLSQLASIIGGGIDIYYDPTAPANDYLNDQTYSLNGGGALAPVPEPSVCATLLLAAFGLLMRRRHRVLPSCC